MLFDLYVPVVVLPKIVFENKIILSCSLEIMEQMALLQETSYERLYRWTQSRTKNVYEYYDDDSFNSLVWIELCRKFFQAVGFLLNKRRGGK